MGIGAAMTGLRPIIEGMNMGFLLLAYNQISNNAGMLHYTSGGQYKVTLINQTCAHAHIQNAGAVFGYRGSHYDAYEPGLDYSLSFHFYSNAEI